MKTSIFIVLLSIALFACDKEGSTRKVYAEITSFNADKCSCCWGWTIIMENDTIKSDSEEIGKTIGYNITHPVSVYLEIGDITTVCSGIDYYEIKQIEKVE